MIMNRCLVPETLVILEHKSKNCKTDATFVSVLSSVSVKKKPDCFQGGQTCLGDGSDIFSSSRTKKMFLNILKITP